jgi:hypothetical protein
MRGADMVVCQAATLLLLFALTTPRRNSAVLAVAAPT